MKPLGLVLLCGMAVAQVPAPVLPQKVVDVSWPNTTGGKVWAAHDVNGLTNAIKAANLGDTIVLDAGVTYKWYWKMPAKTPLPGHPPNQYVSIVTGNYHQLHPYGTRVNPATDAKDMATLATPNVSAVFEFLGGANHYRFVGLNVTSVSTYVPTGSVSKAGYAYFLFGSQSNPRPLPDSIVIDRCWIHGQDPAGTGRGQDIVTAIQGTASNYGVIESYIDQIHTGGQDNQGFAVNDTTGPILLRNNYIEAAGENVMFGGGGGNKNIGVPSDITITGNYIKKPLSWIPYTTTLHWWVAKNAFECKSCQRVLFNGNTVENVWAAGQEGYAIVLTVRSSQTGDASVVNDITIYQNKLINVTAFVNSIAVDDQCGTAQYIKCTNAGSQTRWKIDSNSISFFSQAAQPQRRNVTWNVQPSINRPGGGIPGQMQDVVFSNNTYTMMDPTQPCWNSIFFGTAGQKPPFVNLTKNIWITGNSLCKQPTGDWGLTGQKAVDQYMGTPPPANVRFANNKMALQTATAKCSDWPATNSCF